MEKTTNKKVLSRVNVIVSAAMFALALVVFIISVTAYATKGRAEFFGYSFAVVVTDSMEPEIKVGDMIIVKSCDISEIKKGQNAVFVGTSGQYKGKNIVHKVMDIEEREDGNGIQLRTMGINNADWDKDPVTSDNFIGIEVFHSTALGAIAVFLQNPINWAFLLIIVLLIVVIVHLIIKIIKYAKENNKEKNE